ncbi:sterol carrier family protein [Agromyces archimandritae]|uniref:Bacterial SCP orthologue domain-containing protein n=1 Tax=Agromyces archimandritae TaxID=2781962 RepID=A0A975FNR4_9MICO|nr:sterol carrier family protein [Agromyces archimandritae]QTX05805.1 hypothetical protein G127AT_06275 [Agromyces archimandritae]
MARARIADVEGRDAVRAWARAGADTAPAGGVDAGAQRPTASIDRNTLALAVRYTLQLLAEIAPGHTVEVRVPPFGAVQCVEGPRHTRGTPPNVVETDAETWLALAVGDASWQQARDAGRIHASGSRADLTGLVPVVDRVR